jgi:energy-converting hydrogenase Eha subunit H
MPDMMLKLIIKDIRGYWRFIIFWIFLPGILWISIFLVPLFPPRGIIIFCAGAIVAAISYFTFSEKKQRLETLVCSLPVPRRSVVMARYLLSLFIMIFGIMLFYCAIYTSYIIHAKPLADFNDIYGLNALFIVLLVTTVSASIILPAIYKFRIMGMIFTLPVAFNAGMYLALSIFRFSDIPYLELSDGNLLKIIMTGFVMLAAPVISLNISLKLYEIKDL